MNLSTPILGTTAVRQLQATSSAWVLLVGSDRLTRADLARVGCFNFMAARNLSTVLEGVPVKSLADLYARLPPHDLALPHLGVISLAVLGAAFEAKGIGGDAPLENWVRKHAPRNGGGEAHLVSFSAIKRQEAAREAAAAQAQTRRRRRR